MRKIDTWLFVTFFIALYICFFWFFSFISTPFFAPLVSGADSYILILIAIIIASLACSFAAFGLRSYYLLPTSLVKLVNIVVILLLVSSVIGLVVEKQFTLEAFGLSLLTAAIAWLVVYVSFNLSDRYFSK